ncbi:MAG: DUF1553 domain-containing protein [Pirellulaceae bacterium]
MSSNYPPHSIRSSIARLAAFSLMLLAAIASAAETSVTPAHDTLTVFPASIELSGPESSAGFTVQHLIQTDAERRTTLGAGFKVQHVMQTDAERRATLGADFRVQHTERRGNDIVVGPQWSSELTYACDNPQIARVEAQRVIAVADGQTDLLIQQAGKVLARVPITVKGTAAPQRWQFTAHVQSILARSGCNSGACHGALAGKGGFRLSLHGYDSVADHFSITRQDHGRRIEPEQPGRSLLLAKPSMLVPHKGGLRLAEDSADYRVLAEWIASGFPGPQGADVDAALDHIEVLPTQMQLAPDDTQSLIVRAHYADGRCEDVTHWAKFTSTNAVVAQVDAQGEVTIMGPGKGAISTWFGSRIAMASVVVPYATAESSPLVAERAYDDFHSANLIDDILLEEWRALGLSPSPTCSDETFVRRAYIDATGTIPTPEQVREFLGSTHPDRRQRLVEELFTTNAFVDYWSYQWSNLLLVNGNLLRPDAVAAFYKWIRAQVEANTPWDQFAREIVLAKGESTEQGATNFYALHQDPESLTENTCQAFMGLSIGCAKCHNHPLEKWTNDQYYGMANLFARVRAKGWGGDARNGDGKRTLVVLDQGDLIQPSTGKPQPPTPLDATPLAFDDRGDRREALAQWLTSPENRYFSRAIANRVWAAYMGVGLVEAVDDLRASNPASSERLLNALADYLVEHNYDLKALMRLILTSQTYQRSSETVAGNAQDNRLYSRYYARRLMAEVLLDAVVRVTGVPTDFKEIEFSSSERKPTDFYPEGTGALELYDSAVVNTFLKTFGRHQRRITCDCERSDQPTIIQVLHLNNGHTINDKLASPQSIVAQWLRDDLTAAEVIDQAYLRSLSRFPSSLERERLFSLISQADAEGVERSESYQDVLWSLMTSQEFLFVH